MFKRQLNNIVNNNAGQSTQHHLAPKFKGYSKYFELLNDASNPHYLIDELFPALSIIDSVFAAQLLLCLSFGGWVISITKWLFFEDRPYWWVRETKYYLPGRRPQLQQTHQTCETGPGSPSGHSNAAAIILSLTTMFIAHVAIDRKWDKPVWVKSIVYPAVVWLLGSVMFARMYVAAHFPHQCMIGAILGLVGTLTLCVFVADPYIWQYGYHSHRSPRTAMLWHCVCALIATGVAVLTYQNILRTMDPLRAERQAFRWCIDPDYITLITTPMVLAESTGYMLGWAVAVTPAVTKYRHNTQNRSLLISALLTTLTQYTYMRIDNYLSRTGRFRYISVYFLTALKTVILLRIVPAMSMYKETRGNVSRK